MAGPIALVIFAIAMTPLSVIWRGYVLSVLWAWFLVPYGLPAIGIAAAHSVVKVTLIPALALLIGWIVAAFI